MDNLPEQIWSPLSQIIVASHIWTIPYQPSSLLHIRGVLYTLLRHFLIIIVSCCPSSEWATPCVFDLFQQLLQRGSGYCITSISTSLYYPILPDVGESRIEQEINLVLIVSRQLVEQASCLTGNTSPDQACGTRPLLALY